MPIIGHVMNRFIKRLKDRLDIARGTIEPTAGSPDELLDELLHDVQLRRVYADGMAFVDMMPAAKLSRVLKIYKQDRHDPDFNLHEFVKEHFKDYLVDKASYTTNSNHDIEQHIETLWTVLRRESPKSAGSLIGLPRPYIVAGGRFSAQFYWDSYFTMLGLATSGHWGMVENMVKNCAYLIRKYGFVLNGNRTYLSSRSQPPFFALMVRLLATEMGRSTLVVYLPAMLAEYKFWMKGSKELLTGNKNNCDHLVLMPDGELLNRYCDHKSTPRPESYKEDVQTALDASDRAPSKVYHDIRAAAESGWDFSSRWFADGKNLITIEAAHIVPVDLNSLLVILEQTIADAYDVLKQSGVAKKWRRAADERAAAINKYCWDEKKKFYFDFNFARGERTKIISAAGPFPLFAGISTKQQAKGVAGVVRRELLKKGGLLTTTVQTGQQWDAPNGWAPLQWVAIKAFRRYGAHELADSIKRRWLLNVEGVFKDRGKLVEKYNVVSPVMPAGGGEYVLQDGFGWTNGTTLALLHEDKLKLG